MTKEEAIKQHGIPDKIYCGDSNELNKIHQDKKFQKTEIVHNPKRYQRMVFRYGRELIHIMPAKKVKPKETKKAAE